MKYFYFKQLVYKRMYALHVIVCFVYVGGVFVCGVAKIIYGLLYLR